MIKHTNISVTLLVSLCLVILTGCSNINLPAVTEKASNSQLEGKIIWHDLISDKPKLTEEFYQTLFGWEFEKLTLAGGLFGEVNYTLIRHNGKLIGGMVDQNKLKVEKDISQWVVLMSVKDIDNAVDEVKNSGGTVFTPVTDLGDRGKVSIVADPQGALLGFIETKFGDPVDSDAVEIGDFLWTELWTVDVDKATDFYKKIALFTIKDKNVDSTKSDNKHYRVLRNNNKARVGIMSNPVENLQPLWVSYIRVKDAKTLDEMVSKVNALKGEILLAPQDRDLGGRVALIAGPSGAGIALQTWPEESIPTTVKTIKIKE